jgi:DNA-binding NarL/FixJ family response regulator
VSTVVICDQASQHRRSLAERVAALPEVDQVDVVDDPSGLILLLASRPPSVVLLSSHPRHEGARAVVLDIRQWAPASRILLLTMGTDPDEVVSGIAVGADGYVARDASLAELAAAFVLLPPRTADSGSGLLPPGQRRNPGVELTDRELQVLEGMSRGRSNSEIGQDLFLSEDTIKTHARRLFRKMSVNDRAHAVAEGFRRGLLG